LYRKASFAPLSSDSVVVYSIIRSLILKESFILVRNCVVRKNVILFLLAILVILLGLVNNE
jgi:hypothetical protein